MDEEIVIIDESEEKRTQNKMNYAKLAGALDKFKHICSIQTPDINKSRLGFMPDSENNTIIYGLKGISKVTDPAIEQIMMYRPFKSLDDFLTKVTKKIVSKDKIINLIKCGAFDRIENKSRKEIMEEYIWTTCEPKTNLTMQNANMLIDHNLLPQEFEYEMQAYKLTKELRKHRDAAKLWYCGDRIDVPLDKVEIWKQIIADSGVAAQDLFIAGEVRRVLDSRKWDAFYDNKMLKIKKYISEYKTELLEKLNNKLFSDEFNKYCSGDELQWELDSLNFFFSGHPLEAANEKLDTTRLEDIIEGAQDNPFNIDGKIIPKMKLYHIIGTVIDKDKVKGTVTIQTPDGVATLKIYKDLFATLAYVDSVVDVDGNKIVYEDSFLEKGTHLSVVGIQRGSTFVPKTYKSTGRKAIMKIEINDRGRIERLVEKAGS